LTRCFISKIVLNELLHGSYDLGDGLPAENQIETFLISRVLERVVQMLWPEARCMMRRRVDGLHFFALAFLVLSQHALAGGMEVTPLQKQATSSVLIATNWKEGTSGINNPLVFNQFDPKLGTLQSVNMTFTANVTNDYILNFVTTPTLTTIYVATSATTDPAILSNPTERAQLTDGPTVTLFAPNSTTVQLFGPPATRQPVDFVMKQENTTAMFSSLVPPFIIIDGVLKPNPYYVAPTDTSTMLSRTLTLADAPSLFPDFIGNGTFGLPVTATAFSSFFCSSGNGGGGVITKANAIVTIQYVYTALTIPEPSSIVLLGVGIGISFVAATRLHRRAGYALDRDRI
jgi:hypothetical protein